MWCEKMTWDDTALTDCDHCGKIRECSYEDDPFMAEVYDEDEENECPYWCRECYEDRQMEV